MAKNKFALEFKGFEEISAKLQDLGGDLEAVTEKALQNTHDYITPQLHKAMQKHHRTGRTEGAIADSAKVQWGGNVASVDVGFEIGNGGIASIFLMHGTPRMSPDRNLYNAVYGSKTKKQVAELQEKTFSRAIQKALGG